MVTCCDMTEEAAAQPAMGLASWAAAAGD